MVELRTLTFMVQAVDTTTTVSHLFDKRAVIKKIFYSCTLGGVADADTSGYMVFGKHDAVIAHEKPGDLIHIHLSDQRTAAAGGSSTSESGIIDLGADYIDVEEDDYLYLRAFSSVALGTMYATVIIYYTEKG